MSNSIWSNVQILYKFFKVRALVDTQHVIFCTIDTKHRVLEFWLTACYFFFWMFHLCLLIRVFSHFLTTLLDLSIRESSVFRLAWLCTFYCTGESTSEQISESRLCEHFMRGCYFLPQQHSDAREWRWLLVFGALILAGFQHNNRVFFQVAASRRVFTFSVEQTAFSATNAVKYENCNTSSNIVPQPARADWLMKPVLGKLNCHSVSFAHWQPCGNNK